MPRHALNVILMTAVQTQVDFGASLKALAAGLLVVLLWPHRAAAQTYDCPNSNWPMGVCESTECAASGSGTCNPTIIWTGPDGNSGDSTQICSCAPGNVFYRFCDLHYGGGLCSPGVCGCWLGCMLTTLTTQPCPPAVQPIEVGCNLGGSGGSSNSNNKPTGHTPQSSIGKPVSLTTGAAFFTHTDAVVGDLVFSRTYNSLRTNWNGFSATYGAFGPGWNASVEIRLDYVFGINAAARNADGNPQYYRDTSGTGVFKAVIPRSAESQITTTTCPSGLPPNGTCYQRSFRAGGFETFWINPQLGAPKLVSATDAAGIVTTYTYDTSYGTLSNLLSVKRLGRSIAIDYDPGSTYPKHIYLGDASGQPSGLPLATYAYTSGFLSSVTYADGSGYQYFPDTSFPPLVASVIDLEGKKIEAHTYDSSGRALTSESGDGVERLTFAYGTPQATTVEEGNALQPFWISYNVQTNTVTDALGNVSTYTTSTRGSGVARVTQATAPCSSCGGGQGTMGSWEYDDAGNITSYTDGAGSKWTYTYDPNTGDLLTETTPPPENAQTIYTYYPDGRVETITRPDGGLSHRLLNLVE
jgi:YD repeat-containing protein